MHHELNLPDISSLPENRTADAHVCRAIADGCLEVVTHPGRQCRRRREFPGDRIVHLGQPFECGGGRLIERRHSHQAEQCEILSPFHSLAHLDDPIGSGPSPGADDARIDFGVDGTGQKVCVLSDGVDSLADRVASGDLPNDVDVLAGQAGSGDEGTAMLELIHDIAPGADLGFATAFNSLASFAQNIIDLRADGCTVIVDDITYFVESNMQDGPIAQAVTTVRNDGAIYFSSSSNSGNLPDGTSGTWQGDFDDEGAATGPLAGSGNVHGWGQTGTPYNTLTAGTQRVDLMWADPLAGSANDYDLYGLDAAGANVVRASTATQDGNDDPYEAIGSMSTGQRVAVVKFSGANRFLTTYTNRGRLTFATGGAARGHNASVDAISTAATPAADPFGPGQPSGPYPGQHSGTNVSETFSSDGPVRQFFTPAGVALTPGNFSATGGVLRNGAGHGPRRGHRDRGHAPGRSAPPGGRRHDHAYPGPLGLLVAAHQAARSRSLEVSA